MDRRARQYDCAVNRTHAASAIRSKPCHDTYKDQWRKWMYAAHNLEWMDVLALFEKIGTVHRMANDKFAFDLAGEHYLIHKPHTKDLTSSEVVDLRYFLQRAGWSPEAASQAEARPDLEPATLMVVVDHHGAKELAEQAFGGRS